MDKLSKQIKMYFDTGFSNKEILNLLAHLHKTVISVATLKRKLKSSGLFRRKNHTDVLQVAVFIAQQQEDSGVLHGYRWMHLKCLQSGYRVPRDTVYHLMQVLDPNGMKSRLRKRLQRRKYSSPGPNFVWHVDSYDKLKPYGIAINGCIDGYSRYVIWLEAATTNNDPKVIANYYIDAVKENKGCPARIRADFGTENMYIENMQTFLRRHHDDMFAGERSYMAGKSTHNQRIEWFWGIVRKEMAQFYMDLFSDLNKDDNDLFCGDLLDKNIIQFCFMKIIQTDLDDVRVTWNTHTLQTKETDVRVGKRPVLLYALPELYRAEDRICTVQDDEVLICQTETARKKCGCSDETVSELCALIMEESGMSEPSNATEAKDLYIYLRQNIRMELQYM